MTLQDWMKVRKVTQVEIAARLEITAQAVTNKYRNGKFYLNEVRTLRDVLGISLEQTIDAIEAQKNYFEKLKNYDKLQS